LVRKTTTLNVHHAFLDISLPSLHDYDVKMPNSTVKISLSFSKLECGPQEINSLKIRSLDIYSELEQTRQGLKKREFILKVTFCCRRLG